MSSLVSCPICSKRVPEWYVNDHLDHECLGVIEDSSDNKQSQSSKPLARQTSLLISPSRNQQTQESRPLLAKRARAESFSEDMEMCVLLPSEQLSPTDASSPVPVPLPPTLIGSQAQGAMSKMENAITSEDAEVERRVRNLRLPLAERLRPLTLDAFVGQRGLVGPGSILRSLIESDQISSMIFWGGPGLGKTTLARIIARKTKAAFKEMSAVTQNTADVKKAIDEAGNLSRLTNKRTIVFLDEIHRFNKAQQDIFLPHLERGQIVLIGATTENPSFKLNGALLSRCRVFRLEALSEDDIAQIAEQAAKVKQTDRGQAPTGLEKGLSKYIAGVSNGDARAAINVVDLAMNSLAEGESLGLECVKRALQRTHIVYGAEEHYDLISALHKSVRGSDANAALYWLARMLQGGDDPLYIARRMVRMASEDIGLADSHALPLAVSTLHACQAIGLPECDTVLAHCATYLARAPKSVETYKAFKEAKAAVGADPPWPVPLHLRNAPTRLMKELGYAEGYKYNPDYDEPVEQEYLPEAARHFNFFKKY
ncbi:DNA-dependent ATPase mgs1 [Coemansia pectinata]|uniref:DNA-dependent ATPase mgs1 n=1 Tax=Coemansia pectinata TaxID=1052879 RepID=A0A9W8LDA5_9FUNG|nr:DNA-dependent ATPase mgs1 [Coemansia pectinata]